MTEENSKPGAPAFVDIHHLVAEMGLNSGSSDLILSSLREALVLVARTAAKRDLIISRYDIHAGGLPSESAIFRFELDSTRMGHPPGQSISRLREMSGALDRLGDIDFGAPVNVILGDCVYTGMGLWPRSGERLRRYNTVQFARFATPFWRQKQVDVRLTIGMLRAAGLLTDYEGPRASDVILVSVDQDFVPVTDLMARAGVRVHLLHAASTAPADALARSCHTVTPIYTADL